MSNNIFDNIVNFTLTHCKEGRSIIFIENAKIEQFSLFINKICELASPTKDELISIMAPPECNNLQLHELILENSCLRKELEFNQPTNDISYLRRGSWYLLGNSSLLTISQGEYLQNIALQEINDLRNRVGGNYIIGFSEKMPFRPEPHFKAYNFYGLNLAVIAG